MTTSYTDKGSLYLGASRWLGYSGPPYSATMEITSEKIEFNPRLLWGLLKRVYVFQKSNIYSIERKLGWWVIKDGFIIVHSKGEYPMYICYTTWHFDIVRERMKELGWEIKE